MTNSILTWRLDLVLFAVLALGLCAAVFFSRRADEHRSLGIRIADIAFSVVVLTAGLMEFSGNMERARISDTLSGYAPGYARMMMSEGIDQLSLDTPSSDPLYLRLIELEKQWLELNPAVNDIYTFARKPDGSVALLVDSETDYDRSGTYEGDREQRTLIGEPYESNPAIEKAFGGQSVFDSEPYTDRWGTWVSAYHPLRAKSGEVIGVLGVDYDAMRLVSAVLWKRLIVATVALVVLFLLVFSFFLKRYSSLTLILVFGVALSFLVAWSVHLKENRSEELAFRLEAAERASRFVSTLEDHLNILTAIESFYVSSSSVGRDEFKTFTKPFLEDDREITSLQWIPYVPAAERGKAEAAAAEDGLGKFEFTELDAQTRPVRASERSDYYPAYFVEPVEKNRPVLGYDHGSDPVRRAAIEKARETGQTVVTPGIVSEAGKRSESSAALVLRPISKNGIFLGIAAGVYDVADIFQTSIRDFEPANLRFVIRDITPGSPRDVLTTQDSGEITAASPDSSEWTADVWRLDQQFRFCDRAWELIVTPIRERNQWKDAPAWITLFAGIAMTLVLSAYLFMLIRNAAHQEQLAEASRRAAEALKISEERSRAIVETANDAFVTIDAAGIVQDVNHNAELLFGWSKDEIVGHSLAERVIPERFRDAHRSGMRKFFETGAGPVLNKRIEISALHREKGEFPIELMIWPVKHAEGIIFSAFIHDISDRKASEARIRRNEQYIELLRDVAFAANQAASSSAAFKFCLEKVCELMQWPVGHVYALRGDGTQNLYSMDIWRLPDPEPFKEFKRVSEEISFAPGFGLPGRVLQSKQAIWIPDVTKDPHFPRAQSAQNIRVKGGMGFPVMVKDEVVAVLEFFSTEVEQTSPQLLEIMTQIGNQLGRVVEREQGEKLLKDALDEARKANNELKLTQSRLIQADRLSAIGQLAAGVAHEINNPIGFVNSNLSTLKKYGASLASYQEAVQNLLTTFKQNKNPDEALREADQILALGERLKVQFIFTDIGPLIEESQSGLDRVKKIILDLKTFVRADSKEAMDLLDLNEILNGTVSVVWNELKYKANLVKELGDIPKVNCNGQQMGQVFINMLVNAAQAIKETGTITVRSYVKDAEVCIEIEDTGEGIPDDVMDHIFDPFFTTKEVGKGTGLGLGISYDIVKKHDGRIEVVSKVGQGTKFTVILPLTSCPLPPSSK